MKRPIPWLLALSAALVILVAACSPAASTQSPTQSPVAGTQPPTSKAAETSKPAATQPAADQAKKTGYPEKGKTITWIVPYGAGGNSDSAARTIAAVMEKDLGVSVAILNKPGAGGQVGTTELALAKPDGYTIGTTNLPSIILTYLDAERKAAYGRKDLQPISSYLQDPMAVVVKTDSPYKSLQDLIDAAKANPGQIKVGEGGFMSQSHIAWLQLEKQAGMRFALVHFDGDSSLRTAVLGGHIDAALNSFGGMYPPVKNGDFRLLGIVAKEESKFAPGVKTLEAQGYKVYAQSAHVVSAPKDTPKEIVSTLSSAINRAVTAPEVKERFAALGVEAGYMDTAKAEEFWSSIETDVAPYVDEARASANR